MYYLLVLTFILYFHKVEPLHEKDDSRDSTQTLFYFPCLFIGTTMAPSIYICKWRMWAWRRRLPVGQDTPTRQNYDTTFCNTRVKIPLYAIE